MGADTRRPGLSKRLRRRLVRWTRRPRVGRVKFGHLRRTKPISRSWGGDRGTPVDRYYIERFLTERRADIRGRVLEFGNDLYTRRFGEGIERVDIWHPVAGNRRATIVADLGDAPGVPGDQFDCVICTQTLQLIPDVAAAVATLHRMLAPGGVLLATVPTVSRLEISDEGWHDYWRFTSHGARRLFTPAFGRGQVQATAYGNVLAATAFLQGLAREELTEAELNVADPVFEMVIAIRAVKAGGGR